MTKNIIYGFAEYNFMSRILVKQENEKFTERRRVYRPELLSLAEFKRMIRSLPKIAGDISAIRIRQATHGDIPELLQVESAAWPEEARASEEMLSSRVGLFPEGVLCAVVNFSIVGFICTEIIDQQPEQIHENWSQLTDDGYIRKTHNPSGTTLFGVSMSVLPGAPTNTAFALCESAKKLAIRKHLPFVVLGSRIPRFHRFADTMDVEEYIQTFRNGKHLDPELDLYKRIGLVPIRPLPGFFPDPASCNFGVLMIWKNPLIEESDRLNLWEQYHWFSLWDYRSRRRKKPWRN